MLKKQLLDEKYQEGVVSRKALVWAGLGKSVAALSLAATLVATPAAAFADQQAAATSAPVPAAATEQAQVPAAPEAQQAPAAQEPTATTVAKIGNTTYATVQAAVDAAKAGQTITLTAPSSEDVTVRTLVTFNAEAGATFSGSITFKKGSEGSTVDGLTFTNDGTKTNVKVDNVDGTLANPVTIQNSHFSTPSALLEDKGGGNDWQPNSIMISYSEGVKVLNNTFELGRIAETGESGQVGDANVAVNLAGADGNVVKDIELSGNTTAVLAPSKSVTATPGVYYLVAMGTINKDAEYGVQDVMVSGNSYDSAADPTIIQNGKARFANISNVSNMIFTGNTVKNAGQGIGQSTWDGKSHPSDAVSIDAANTFENVSHPIAMKTAEDNVAVVCANGTATSYSSFKDAVDAANNAGGGAVVNLYESVSDHGQYAFNHKVQLVGTSTAYFNGSITLGASGSEVSGFKFEIDYKDYQASPAFQKGVENSLVLAEGVSDTTITGSEFTIPSMDLGKVDFQPNAIVLNHGVTGTKINGNTFKLGRSFNNSTVGINFIGNGDKPVKNTEINGNTVVFTADKGTLTSGSVMFTVANGNANGKYGVQGITARNNSVDGTQVADRDYAIAISDVKDITLEDNTVKGVYMAVSPSLWGGTTAPSTGLKLYRNTLADNTMDVYLNEVLERFGKPDMVLGKDIIYGGGSNQNYVVKGAYQAKAPTVNGLLFVGWYKDKNFTQAAGNGDKTVYAKLIPKSVFSDVNAEQHNAVINFMGRALRYGEFFDADKNPVYDKTSMRFGFSFSAPQGTTLVKWGWNWGENGGELKNVTSTSSTKRVTKGEGATIYQTDPSWVAQNDFVSNLVLTGIPSKLYATDFAAVPYAVYQTPDGTQVTVTGEKVNMSVQTLAQKIAANPNQSTDARNYAQEILKVNQGK